MHITYTVRKSPEYNHVIVLTTYSHANEKTMEVDIISNLDDYMADIIARRLQNAYNDGKHHANLTHILPGIGEWTPDEILKREG